MSTFSTWSGGSDATNYQYLHSKLVEIENAIKNKVDEKVLNQKLDELKKSLSTGTLVVTEKTTTQALEVNAKTTTHDLDVKSKANIKELTTDTAAFNTATVTNGVKAATVEVSESVKTKAVEASESIKTSTLDVSKSTKTVSLDVSDTTNLKKLNVSDDTHAHDIYLGTKLDFEHFKKLGPVCGCKSHQTFVLAKVKTNKSPGIVFVSSPQDPHLKILVQFTAESIMATYSRYSKDDVVKYIKRGLDFGDKKVTLPGIALALHETADSTYLVLYVSVDSTDNAPGNPSVLTLDTAIVNCEHATPPALTLTASNIKRLVPLRYKAGFAADNASFNNASMFKAIIEDAEIKKEHVETSNIDKATIQNAEIVKEHVQTSEIDKATIQNAEIIKEHVQTSEIDNATIQNAEIKKEHVVTSEIDNATIKEVTILKGTATLDTLTVTGETKLAHTTIQGGLTTDTIDASGTVKALTLQSNVVKDMDDNVMVSSEGDKMTVGNVNETLNIVSKDRPTINDTQKMAYLSDLINSIVYQGKVHFYAEAVDQLPAIGTEIPLNNEGTKKYTVKDDDTALIAKPTETEKVEIYKATAGKWELSKTIKKGLYAYEWHADYVKEADDKYYHEASVIWAPNASQDIKVSIINLPLEDYYNIEQIEKIKALLIKLSTAQTDWFETKPEIEIEGKSYDNPRYLRNRPVTGVSALMAGNWSKPIVDKVKTVVIGGNFKDAQLNMNHAFGPVQEYFKNVIMSLFHGMEAELPAAHETTAMSLKYCIDTGNLYLDVFGTDIAKDTTHKIVNGNLLIATLKEHKFIEDKIVKPSQEGAEAIVAVAVDTTEVPVDNTATNKLLVEGRRVINNEYQNIAWTIQTDKRLRIRKTNANAEGDYNIIIDLYVQDILDSLQKLRKDLTELQEAFAKEVVERKEADVALGKRIDTEAEMRLRTDKKLQEAVDGLHSVDVEIYGAIEKETKERMDKDTELQAAIDAEKKAREEKDTELKAAIDKEIQDRTDADTALGKRIDDEATERKAEDKKLQAAIDAITGIKTQFFDSMALGLKDDSLPDGMHSATLLPSSMAYKVGRLVTLQLYIKFDVYKYVGSVKLKDMTEALRPATDIYCIYTAISDLNATNYTHKATIAKISTDGEITLINKEAVANMKNCLINVSYISKE